MLCSACPPKLKGSRGASFPNWHRTSPEMISSISLEPDVIWTVSQAGIDNGSTSQSVRRSIVDPSWPICVWFHGGRRIPDYVFGSLSSMFWRPPGLLGYRAIQCTYTYTYVYISCTGTSIRICTHLYMNDTETVWQYIKLYDGYES